MNKSMPSVKTAISLKKQLFLQVDKIAREQKLPRSQVFVQALEAFVARYHNQVLLEQLNEAYAGQPEAAERKRMKAARKTHRRIVEGEW
jgi:metal-responsive CopG/Arc/MetJ family transcriptional regulator